MELQLFKLYHNEQDIDGIHEEITKKQSVMEKEIRKRDKIEEEMRDKKKEHGKLIRELGNIDKSIKECVCNFISSYWDKIL